MTGHHPYAVKNVALRHGRKDIVLPLTAHPADNASCDQAKECAERHERDVSHRVLGVIGVLGIEDGRRDESEQRSLVFLGDCFVNTAIPRAMRR